MSNSEVLTVKDFWKSYDKNTVLEGVNLKIERGSIHGILGRNGAGKTTFMECLVGLRKPDSGTATIYDGNGAVRTFQKMKEHVGVQPQEIALFERQTVRETFELFESFYENSLSVDFLIDKLKLSELENKQIRKLSGGQKQRVVIGVSVIGDPEILLLDEPSSGLDVQVRMLIWNLILEFKKQGKTILLTTHYMEEAEKLCDSISILYDKKIVATDHPKAIIQKYAKKNNQSLDNAFVNLTGTDLRMGVD
ncbi:ABC transporter ATP-binding protein [Alkalihalobacillus sp. R86527]|uniref:ABC transporter ATP-binding protein n=1 Tax=Alkalihalobacillus sp. R86527 TaxID=3093863 RepID=UPI0036733CDD